MHLDSRIHQGIGAAGFVFSLPFFYKNLARLFLRYRSVVDSSIDASQYDKDYKGPTRTKRVQRGEVDSKGKGGKSFGLF